MMMMEAREREELKKGMRTTWIIWAHMFSGLFAYIGIGYYSGNKQVFTVGPDFPVVLLTSILYGVAIAELLFAYFFRRAILRVGSYESEEKFIAHASKSNKPPFIGKYNVALLVSLALAESIGIYGVVLFFLGGGFETLLNFTAISAMAMLFFRPKRKELQQLSIAMRRVVLRFENEHPFHKNAPITPSS